MLTLMPAHSRSIADSSRNYSCRLGSGLSFLRDDIPVLEKLYYELREPVYARRRKTIKNVLANEFGVACSCGLRGAPFCPRLFRFLFERLSGRSGGHDGCSRRRLILSRVPGQKWTVAFPSQGRRASTLSRAIMLTSPIFADLRPVSMKERLPAWPPMVNDTYSDIIENFIGYQDGTVVNRGKLILQVRA